MRPTESQGKTTTQLSRIAWLSKRDPEKVYHCLMHHINEASLKVCYHELDGKKACGIDEIDKAQYGERLEENLRDLIARMKKMAYRPGPVREVRIPKEGKHKATRTLGISNFEDKLVQRMLAKVLNSIYDPLLSDQLFGFRPNKGCHDAIKALHSYLCKHPVQTVIDIDLENYFGTIDQKRLVEILRKKIKDERFIRYLIRFFKAGTLSDGELIVSEEGVSQGSAISPILSNIYAQEVMATWFEETVKAHCRGKVEIFAYADDMVIACQFPSDAERIKRALIGRLAKYGLKLNLDKTQLVRFSKQAARQKIKQGTFDYLGFTFYLDKTRKGSMTVKLQTSSKRMAVKLKRINQWARRTRNRWRLHELWKLLRLKVAGHIRYYGVTYNCQRLTTFIYRVTRIMFKWLNRRSQRKSFTWEQFNLFLERYPLPKAKIYQRLF